MLHDGNLTQQININMVSDTNIIYHSDILGYAKDYRGEKTGIY